MGGVSGIESSRLFLQKFLSPTTEPPAPTTPERLDPAERTSAYAAAKRRLRKALARKFFFDYTVDHIHRVFVLPQGCDIWVNPPPANLVRTIDNTPLHLGRTLADGSKAGHRARHFNRHANGVDFVYSRHEDITFYTVNLLPVYEWVFLRPLPPFSEELAGAIYYKLPQAEELIEEWLQADEPFFLVGPYWPGGKYY